MADHVDAVLGGILTQDKHARGVCKSLPTTGLVAIVGKITSSDVMDFSHIGRQSIKRFGNGESVQAFMAKLNFQALVRPPGVCGGCNSTGTAREIAG